MRGGFAIVEVLIAATVLGFTTAAFFSGEAFFARRVRENSERLTAEAVAWDAVWKTFNEPLQNFQVHNPPIGQGEREFIQSLREEEAAQLYAYDTAPQLRLKVVPLGSNDAAGELNDAWWSRDLVRISADLEWGNRARRQRLSDFMEVPVVYRGGVRRAFPR